MQRNQQKQKNFGLKEMDEESFTVTSVTGTSTVTGTTTVTGASSLTGTTSATEATTFSAPASSRATFYTPSEGANSSEYSYNVSFCSQMESFV